MSTLKKLLTTLVFLSLFAGFVLADENDSDVCANNIFSNSLSLSSSVNLHINGDSYNLTLLVVSGDKTKFKLQSKLKGIGEVTDSIQVGDTYEFSDTAGLWRIGVKAVTNNDSAEFCLLKPSVDCSDVAEGNKRDSCYMNYFVNWADYSVCDSLANPNLKETCEALRELGETPTLVAIEPTQEPLGYTGEECSVNATSCSPEYWNEVMYGKVALRDGHTLCMVEFRGSTNDWDFEDSTKSGCAKMQILSEQQETNSEEQDTSETNGEQVESENSEIVAPPVLPSETTDTSPEESCDGCDEEGTCYPLGYRKSGTYCSTEGFVDQRASEVNCDNNFECQSNLCIDSQCVESGFFQSILNWFKHLFR